MTAIPTYATQPNRQPLIANRYLSQAPRYLPENFTFTSPPFGIAMCIPPVYDSLEYVTWPSPFVPDFSHVTFHDTLLPSILKSVRLQSPLRRCSGASFSGFSASSFVRPYVSVGGVIFVGTPPTSVCDVTPPFPAFAGPAANATVGRRPIASTNASFLIVMRRL